MKYRVVQKSVTFAVGQILAGLSKEQFAKRQHLLEKVEGGFACTESVTFKLGETFSIPGDDFPRAIQIGIEPAGKAKVKKPESPSSNSETSGENASAAAATTLQNSNPSNVNGEGSINSTTQTSTTHAG